MRKLLHTPKDGLIIPETADFYKELLEENQYLRKFINGFDERLAKDINLVMKRRFSIALIGTMKRTNTIRQAHSNTISASPTRKESGLVQLQKQATIRKSVNPSEEESSFGSDSDSNESTKVSPGPDHKGRTKHKKILDPKDDKFSKKDLQKMQIEKSASKQRLDRAISYNKQIEILHLSDRKAIKALPLDKQEFAKQLNKYNNPNAVVLEEQHEEDQYQEMTKRKQQRFESMFAKHRV